MRNVLADLALEVEAATALALRVARTFEAADRDPDRALGRLLTPAAKYWICKRGPPLAAEAMEVLGGSGYVEESMLPRLYREMPVNSIWEGSANVMCLDVLRALRRGPESVGTLIAELTAARGADRVYDRFVDALTDDLGNLTEDPSAGRRLAQAIATAVEASLLIRHAPSFVADAFCATRLAPSSFAGAAFGTLPASVDAGAIIARALPN